MIAGSVRFAVAHTRIAGAFRFLYRLISGIIQGSSTSGFNFAISFDPFVRKLEHIVHNPRNGTVGVCADDIECQRQMGSEILLTQAERLCDVTNGVRLCCCGPLTFFTWNH